VKRLLLLLALLLVSIQEPVFTSGFESVYITGDISTTSSKDGWIEGEDFTALKTGDYPGLPWVKQAYGWFQGGRMEIDQTAFGYQVLRLHNTHTIDGLSRSQWQLNHVPHYWDDDGLPNTFDQQYIRYKMYIPSIDIAYRDAAPWYMIWESHTWPQFENGNLTRHGIYLQKRANSDHWYFWVVQTRPEGCHRHYNDPVGCEAYWENVEGQNFPVPFDRWFTFEVFFKYHETEGEWYVAVDGTPVADYQGQTRWNGEKFHDIQPFKNYHSGVYGETSIYYDDLEIWNDYPPKCVRVTWLLGLKLRPSPSMYNLTYSWLSPGMVIEPLSIVENEEGVWAEFGRGWWFAMSLVNRPHDSYAEIVSCDE